MTPSEPLVGTRAEGGYDARPVGRSVRSVVAVALALGWLVLVVSTSASAAPKRGAGKRAPVPPFGWTVDGLVVESLQPAAHAVTATGVGTYAGRLLLTRSPGGVGVVNEVGFEDYVRGISEMPNAWPGEALKAQAIAARTYALWDLAREVPPTIAPYKAMGADICATPACQAYTGLAKTQAEHGERWSAAVDATEGQVLWWRDGPIVAKYSSSNGGRSVPGGQPYLRAIDDPDDRHSPLHRWQSTLSFADVGRAIGLARTPVGVARSGDNVAITVPSAPAEGTTAAPAGVPGVDAGAPEPASPSSSQPPAPGSGQPATATPAPPEAPPVETVLIPVVDFRERVNDSVPTPPGGLPRAVPSVRFDITPAAGAVTLHGRGWGHGIGMSQWGAFGKAARGMKAADILATYYGGLRPTSVGPEVLPEVIRVAVDVERAVADVGVVDLATLGATGAETQAKANRSKPGRFRVSTPDGTVLAHAATGTWRVQPLPKGGLRVIPPAAEAEPATVERVGTDPARPRAGEPVRLKVRVAHPAMVSATVSGAEMSKAGTANAGTSSAGTSGAGTSGAGTSGFANAGRAAAGVEPVAVAEPKLVDAGEVTLELPAPPRAGSYTVDVVTDRGGGRTATATLLLDVGARAGRRQLAAGAHADPTGNNGGLSLAAALAALAAAAALAAVSVATTRTARGLGAEGGGPLH